MITGQYQTCFNIENIFQITLGQNIQSLLYVCCAIYDNIFSQFVQTQYEDNSQLYA